jgi:hypothetical protein
MPARVSIPTLILVGLSVYGFVFSLGRRPLFQNYLLKDGTAAGRAKEIA